MEELELVVDDVNSVPEQFRTLYVEKDGKHHLNITVKGMKPEADLNRTMEALRKERSDHNQTRSKLKPFEGLNIEEVTAQLARIPELEIAAEGKVDDKKVEKIVESRIAQRLGPVQRERDTLKSQVDDLSKTVEGFRTKEKTRTIHDAVRGAASKAKLRDTAVEDALLFAERVFDVDDTGSVMARDNAGVTPGIDPVTWLTEMVNKKPHWFAESAGGGAGGNTRGSGSGTTNPFSREHWNLTEQGRLVRENRAQAENLARAAGTTIGGGMPQPKAR